MNYNYLNFDTVKYYDVFFFKKLPVLDIRYSERGYFTRNITEPGTKEYYPSHICFTTEKRNSVEVQKDTEILKRHNLNPLIICYN
jgi:hypothetical protein